MVHLSGVTKQYGDRVLFKNASFQIRPNDKIGLVGPNGAGKTSLFRLLMREESPDQGTINIPDKTILGYFSQTVGDMRGRTALEEVEMGAGRISWLAQELASLEKKLQDTATHPIPDEAMARLLETYGEIQTEF